MGPNLSNLFSSISFAFSLIPKLSGEAFAVDFPSDAEFIWPCRESSVVWDNVDGNSVAGSEPLCPSIFKCPIFAPVEAGVLSEMVEPGWGASFGTGAAALVFPTGRRLPAEGRSGLALLGRVDAGGERRVAGQLPEPVAPPPPKLPPPPPVKPPPPQPPRPRFDRSSIEDFGLPNSLGFSRPPCAVLFPRGK